MVFLLAVGLSFVVGLPAARFITDWQWFGEMGQATVFQTTLLARLGLFLGFGLLFFLIVFLNVWLAQRMNSANPRTRRIQFADERIQIAEAARHLTYWGLLAATVVVALLVGANAAANWQEYLLFTHAGSFGQADPLFKNDVGFYVFRLPFLSFLQTWFFWTLAAAIAASVAVHAAHRTLDFVAGTIPVVEPFVRRHVLALAGLAAVVFAWGIILNRYNLLVSDNGPFFGAGYTDVHARLPGATISAFLMLAVGALCWVNMFRGRAFLAPALGLAVWGIAFVGASVFYPAFVQRFQVVPNQFNAEKPFIENDIRFTRQAYGLDKVIVKDLPARDTVSGAQIAAHAPTIGNIRLWDWPQLGAVYSNRQANRQYYRFQLPADAPVNPNEFNIDVDRYRIGGAVRQVMLGARELYSDGLPAQAQTWQNRKLQYTHGYGAVMSPVNGVDPQGLPEYYLGEIPVKAAHPEVEVTRPQIYYGELTNEYKFVRSKQKEFDYPSGQGNVETTYEGRGGVPLGGAFNRGLWAARLGDSNMLFASDLTSESRVLFRRNIRERVQSLAPFLRLDNDPYLVVEGGRLVWMLDCYTVSNAYPYSRPSVSGFGWQADAASINYIRNTVKATIDAYDGTVTLFVADDADPIIKAWRRVFPTLFKDMAAMPEGLRAHIRYPEDLFRFQRDIYTTYHMTEARDYYGREDAWQVPIDPTTTDEGGGVERPMIPYYVLMRLPGETREDFILMTPFSPVQKENMAGWMCAKSDPEEYGQLVVYRFPKGSNVNGPRQIMGLVRKDEEISRYQTLLGQRGSSVIYGNLLVIPVDTGLLYAMPLYVQATGAGSLPGMSQVIVATGDRVAMRPTLNAALAQLSGGGTQLAGGGSSPGGAATLPSPNAAQSPAGPASGAVRAAPTPGGPASASVLLDRANAAYQRARAREQEYQSALDDLGKALEELRRGSGSGR
jgi:hypothetical protein